MKGSVARGRAVAAPLVLGLGAVVIWQLSVILLQIKPFVLPSPVAIGTQFANNLPTVWETSVVTGANAIVGLLIGGILGVSFATVAAVAPVVDELSVAVVAALAVIPIVALAPVLYTMFGAGAETARQIVAGIAVFIPVYLNSLRGLRQVRAVHRDLMKVYAASPWQATRAITLPTALPFVFTGLRVASSLAVISALVAEYFGGPVGGLGKAITSAASASNYALAWAYVLGSIVLGLVFYCVTLGLESLASRHRPAA
ncbi:ABC transporter permease [Luethyella okanaganae]|uniref:ABC transporter permease n=1 Tax=Luethyella okanaganae TaxID=69372 RepID=A0ABW1VDF1_9MICO